jgi:hypothetical protein
MLAEQARAQVVARYQMAERRPRNWGDVRLQLLNECQRPSFAKAARYRKPVGKKKNEQTGQWEENFVEGLSIDYALAALRCVTNIDLSVVTIFDDQLKQVVRVTATDLESNVTTSSELTLSKTVERRSLSKGQQPLGTRVNSYGDTVFLVESTEDQFANKRGAAVSKERRNLILSLVPGDLREECEAMCIKVQMAQDQADPDGAPSDGSGSCRATSRSTSGTTRSSSAPWS